VPPGMSIFLLPIWCLGMTCMGFRLFGVCAVKLSAECVPCGCLSGNFMDSLNPFDGNFSESAPSVCFFLFPLHFNVFDGFVPLLTFWSPSLGLPSFFGRDGIFPLPRDQGWNAIVCAFFLASPAYPLFPCNGRAFDGSLRVFFPLSLPFAARDFYLTVRGPGVGSAPSLNFLFFFACFLAANGCSRWFREKMHLSSRCDWGCSFEPSVGLFSSSVFLKFGTVFFGVRLKCLFRS